MTEQPGYNLLNDIRSMDEEMEELIGRTVFGYISNPTPTSQKITFGDGRVCLSMAEAHTYMRNLLIQAQRDPAGLPWPLCEPMPVTRQAADDVER